MGRKVKSRQLRPVVVVEDGAVVEVFPGCGLPVVVDFDENPEAQYFAVGVDDAEIVDTVEDLATALKVAREALAKGARKVDLEVLDEEGHILELFVLHEEE